MGLASDHQEEVKQFEKGNRRGERSKHHEGPLKKGILGAIGG